MRFSISLRFKDTTEVDNLLKSLQNNDLRIIFGFFGHEHARYILCQVRTSTYLMYDTICIYVHIIINKSTYVYKRRRVSYSLYVIHETHALYRE